jgi:hypothetical protein
MRKNKLTFFALFLLSLALIFTACGGGGGGGSDGSSPNSPNNPNSPGTTTFSGGTLDALKALSPTLTFDDLQITGTLTLPLYTNAVITANKVTVTSTGRIGYSYTTCQYVDAPSITINASGDVVFEGEISLTGRSGTTVTESATCNSCYGQDGGNVTITGNTITVSGKILNYGGAGASTHWSFGGSSPCSAGGSGNLKLAATTTMNLSGAGIANTAGKNFEGTAGKSGTATITAGGAFTMKDGNINSTGAMTFTVASTDIWGSITYGTLTESIGGAPDTTPPVVTVLSPLPNTSVTWGQTLQVKVQASDTGGMGLRNVKITGFGYDKTHSVTEFVNGVLTVDISSAVSPATLTVLATDNKGRQTTVSVPGLSGRYPQETEPNDSMSQAQTLNAGSTIQGTILTTDSGSINQAIRTYLQNVPDPLWSTAIVQDWYKITLPSTSTTVALNLDFKGNPGTPDIDLYLLDSTGNLILKVSGNDNPQTGNYTESISYTGTAGATYYLAVQAYKVPTRATYLLTR